MTIRLQFAPNLDNQHVDVYLTPESSEAANTAEMAWGKRILGYAQQVAEKHTFEQNPLREDEVCNIDVTVDNEKEVSVKYHHPDLTDRIGGLTSATFALSSIVHAMLMEALEYNSEPQDEDDDAEDDGDFDWEDEEFDLDD